MAICGVQDPHQPHVIHVVSTNIVNTIQTDIRNVEGILDSCDNYIPMCAYLYVYKRSVMGSWCLYHSWFQGQAGIKVLGFSFILWWLPLRLCCAFSEFESVTISSTGFLTAVWHSCFHVLGLCLQVM